MFCFVIYLLMGTYISAMSKTAHSMSVNYVFSGKVELLPANKCEGLLSQTLYRGHISQITCGTECVRNAKCDYYFTSHLINGDTLCSSAKNVEEWVPKIVQSGTNFMYSKECKGLIGMKYKPKECTDLRNEGVTCSGWYTIYPDNATPKRVYCDMNTEGGGWTVFQKRNDASVDFFRTWTIYADGFGNDTNYWIGNHFLFILTATRAAELYVEVEDWSCEVKYARYSSFYVSAKEHHFQLSVSGYSGTAGNSLCRHNNRHFSTKDFDYDTYTNGHCARDITEGGWWYSHCGTSNLNGVYHYSKVHELRSMFWERTIYGSLKSSKMMLRNRN